MTAPEDHLGGLLRLVYDPATAPSAKRQAEEELQRLSRSREALEWALGALQGPSSSAEGLFFACTAAEQAALYRWHRLAPAQQAMLRQSLWRGATQPGLPHFARAKLAAVLAHVAVLDWPHADPEFWPQLQACLADPACCEAGIDLLSATVDAFHSLAQATASFGAKGKVLSSAIPGIQQRFRELQPVALATLCSMLQTLAAGLPAAVAAADTALAALATKALRGLRHALADASQLPEQQDMSSAAIAALLFKFVAAARPAAAASSSDGSYQEAADQLAAAAMDCATDLMAKYFGAEASGQMLEILVPRLQDTCGLIQQRWAAQRQQQQQQQQQAAAEDPVLTAFVRLLVQFFTTQLSNVEATPHLATALCGILAQVLALSTLRDSPLDTLLFLEVWHAVLGYLDGFEVQLWEVEDSPEAQERIKAAAAAYKEPILAVADLLLAVLCPAGGAAAAQGPALAVAPFSLGSFSGSPGSGSAMEDWLLSVVSGGDSGPKEGQEGSAGAAGAEGGEEEEEAYAVELLVPGAGQGGSSQADSEADVFVRHAESFLGRAIGTFAADMLPRVLLRFQAAAAAFGPACQQAAGGVAAADQVLPTFRCMDACLRLLTRCGPSFPTRGAAESAAALDPAAGSGGMVSGAHAVQCLQALHQLAHAWLQAVAGVAEAAAAQQAGAAAVVGRSAGLAAMLAAGSWLYKAGGALTATWLSQLVLQLVQGAADPEAGPVAQQLVLGSLSSATGLLQALAAPTPALAAWRGVLQRAAVWAAESLLSLSSIALSGALKPPPELLGAIWASEQVQAQLLPTAHASLASPALLPGRASRTLWLSLSDLSLRCWGGQPAAQLNVEARGAVFASLATPLVQLLQQAAAAGGDADVSAAVRQAGAVAASIVQSYAGSPKPLRSIVSSALVAPALPSVLSLLHAGGASAGAAGSKASAALLQLLAASLEVLATELGTEAVEQLLAALVQIFASSGGDPTFESDLLLMRLVVTVLSQGGTQRHAALLMPALRYCLMVWDRTASPQAAAAAEADLLHVRASALAALLSLLRYRWRALAGGGAGSKPPAAPGQPGNGAAPIAAAAAAAAAAQGRAAQQAQALEGEGAAAVARVLQLLLDFFSAAAGLQVVLAAADVRLVLEELYELQVATKLYTLPLFQPLRAPLAAALLSMLCSRLYGAAQDYLGDTLFALAASNWSEFHLAVLPQFVEHRLGSCSTPGSSAGVLGASERRALLALWGQADLDAHSFERGLHAFLNDAAYYELAAAA